MLQCGKLERLSRRATCTEDCLPDKAKSLPSKYETYLQHGSIGYRNNNKTAHCKLEGKSMQATSTLV